MIMRCFAIAAALALPVPGYPAPPTISIEAPMAPANVFAELRDFYVRGPIPAGVQHPGDILVELFKGDSAKGAPIRSLRSQVDPVTGITPGKFMETQYSDGKAWGNVDASQVPDLIKAPPGGLQSPSNKVLVTRTFYAAEILGGVSKAFNTSYLGLDGQSLQDLVGGTYTLRVTGLSQDLAGSVATQQVQFVFMPKLLGRFSPKDHLDKLKAYASAHKLRLLTDPFPGFFKPDTAGTGAYEILGRWSANNAEEIVNFHPDAQYGSLKDVDNALVVYNISEDSATQQLEIGAIRKANLAENPRRTHYLRYDCGEPALNYLGPDGKAVSLPGTIVPMNPAVHLSIARIETGLADPGSENLFKAGDPARQKTVILPKDLSTESLELKAETWVLFGVVTPIQCEVTPDTAKDRSLWFKAGNGIAKIRYQIADAAGKTVFPEPEDKPVGLVRSYPPENQPLPASVYEFKHILKPKLQPGTYQLTMTGIDQKGVVVPGVSARFSCHIRP